MRNEGKIFPNYKYFSIVSDNDAILSSIKIVLSHFTYLITYLINAL